MIMYIGNIFMFMGRSVCLWEVCKFMGEYVNGKNRVLYLD